jgi:hypothetical protein
VSLAQRNIVCSANGGAEKAAIRSATTKSQSIKPFLFALVRRCNARTRRSYRPIVDLRLDASLKLMLSDKPNS